MSTTSSPVTTTFKATVATTAAVGAPGRSPPPPSSSSSSSSSVSSSSSSSTSSPKIFRRARSNFSTSSSSPSSFASPSSSSSPGTHGYKVVEGEAPKAVTTSCSLRTSSESAEAVTATDDSSSCSPLSPPPYAMSSGKHGENLQTDLITPTRVTNKSVSNDVVVSRVSNSNVVVEHSTVVSTISIASPASTTTTNTSSQNPSYSLRTPTPEFPLFSLKPCSSFSPICETSVCDFPQNTPPTIAAADFSVATTTESLALTCEKLSTACTRVISTIDAGFLFDTISLAAVKDAMTTSTATAVGDVVDAVDAVDVVDAAVDGAADDAPLGVEEKQKELLRFYLEQCNATSQLEDSDKLQQLVQQIGFQSLWRKKRDSSASESSTCLSSEAYSSLQEELQQQQQQQHYYDKHNKKNRKSLKKLQGCSDDSSDYNSACWATSYYKQQQQFGQENLLKEANLGSQSVKKQHTQQIHDTQQQQQQWLSDCFSINKFNAGKTHFILRDEPPSERKRKSNEPPFDGSTSSAWRSQEGKEVSTMLFNNNNHSDRKSSTQTNYFHNSSDKSSNVVSSSVYCCSNNNNTFRSRSYDCRLSQRKQLTGTLVAPSAIHAVGKSLGMFLECCGIEPSVRFKARSSNMTPSNQLIPSPNSAFSQTTRVAAITTTTVTTTLTPRVVESGFASGFKDNMSSLLTTKKRPEGLGVELNRSKNVFPKRRVSSPMVFPEKAMSFIKQQVQRQQKHHFHETSLLQSNTGNCGELRSDVSGQNRMELMSANKHVITPQLKSLAVSVDLKTCDASKSAFRNPTKGFLVCDQQILFSHKPLSPEISEFSIESRILKADGCNLGKENTSMFPRRMTRRSQFLRSLEDLRANNSAVPQPYEPFKKSSTRLQITSKPPSSSDLDPLKFKGQITPETPPLEIPSFTTQLTRKFPTITSRNEFRGIYAKDISSKDGILLKDSRKSAAASSIDKKTTKESRPFSTSLLRKSDNSKFKCVENDIAEFQFSFPATPSTRYEQLSTLKPTIATINKNPTRSQIRMRSATTLFDSTHILRTAQSRNENSAISSRKEAVLQPSEQNETKLIRSLSFKSKRHDKYDPSAAFVTRVANKSDFFTHISSDQNQMTNDAKTSDKSSFLDSALDFQSITHDATDDPKQTQSTLTSHRQSMSFSANATSEILPSSTRMENPEDQSHPRRYRRNSTHLFLNLTPAMAATPSITSVNFTQKVDSTDKKNLKAICSSDSFRNESRRRSTDGYDIDVKVQGRRRSSVSSYDHPQTLPTKQVDSPSNMEDWRRLVASWDYKDPHLYNPNERLKNKESMSKNIANNLRQQQQQHRFEQHHKPEHQQRQFEQQQQLEHQQKHRFEQQEQQKHLKSTEQLDEEIKSLLAFLSLPADDSFKSKSSLLISKTLSDTLIESATVTLATWPASETAATVVAAGKASHKISRRLNSQPDSEEIERIDCELLKRKEATSPITVLSLPKNSVIVRHRLRNDEKSPGSLSSSSSSSSPEKFISRSKGGNRRCSVSSFVRQRAKVASKCSNNGPTNSININNNNNNNNNSNDESNSCLVSRLVKEQSTDAVNVRKKRRKSRRAASAGASSLRIVLEKTTRDRPLPRLNKELSSPPIKTTHWTSAPLSPVVPTNQISGQVSSPPICDLKRSKDFGKVSCRSKLNVRLPIGSGLKESFSSLKEFTTQDQLNNNTTTEEPQENNLNNNSNDINKSINKLQQEEENNNSNDISTVEHSNQNPTYLSASDEDLTGIPALEDWSKKAMEMQHVPKIQTSPCPDSLAAQKTFTPFIRRGNPVEEEGHLTIEDAHRRSSTSSEANYVSGWTERVPEEFRPATGKDNLPSFASPQTSRRPVHISRTPEVKVDKKSSPWELKAGPKSPSGVETIIVSADKTATRPRSTLFSEIRKSVFGAGHQTNPQVLEELHRYKEKFQKEKLERTTNEGPTNDPSEFSVENLYTEQRIFPSVSKSVAGHTSHECSAPEASLPSIQSTFLRGKHSESKYPATYPQNFSKQEESPETNLSPPSMGVFEFIPVGDKSGEEEIKPEKPITTPQTSLKSLGMPAPSTNVQESQKVGSVVAEATETPKTQVINQKIICTNAKGLSKMSRIDWAKKRFFEDSKISLESLSQSLASIKAEPPPVNSLIDDKKVNAEVASISSERSADVSEDMKCISLSRNEIINKEASVDKMITRPPQEKLEPPSISARVLRISPTPLKLHKLEKVTLSVSSPKTKLSTPNNFQSQPAPDQVLKLTTLDNLNSSHRTNNIAADTLLPTHDSTDQFQTPKMIASRDEGVQNVSSWCEEATEVIQSINSDNFSTNDQITSEPVQIGFLPKDQINKVDSPMSSTSNVQDTKPQDSFKPSFVSNQMDVSNNQPSSGVDKTKFIQTTVKPIDLGLSFADRKGIRPLSLAEEKELTLRVQSQARGEDVEPTRESMEPSPWSQNSGSSVPIQTVTKLTSSNMLKITSVTRGQPPQLISAQTGRPCLDLKGQVDISSRFESAPKSQTSLVTESTSAMVAQQSEFGTLQQTVQARPIQSNQLQLQKAKLFTGVESQHQISSVPKTAHESIGSPSNDDKIQTDVFSYNISKKDPYQSRQAFTQEAPKARSSTYAHGPKISFASLKAAGKVPNKSAFREESYTYPGGYVRGEYYDLGSEFQRHVPDFQSFKTTREEDYKVITSTASVQSSWTQSSTVATSSIIPEPLPQTSKLIFGSSSLDSRGNTQQIFSQTSPLVTPSFTVPITSNITTTRNVQSSPTRLQGARDKHENGQKTTRRSLETSQISETLAQFSKQGKISSQDSTPSTCQTTDDGPTNRTFYIAAATQDRHESYDRYEIKQQEFLNQQQLEEQQKLQYQQQQLNEQQLNEQQQSPEQHPRKSEVHKPVHVQKISVSSNQMKITTDLPTSQQKAIHVISTVKKTSPQLEIVQTSKNSEVETPNREKEPPHTPVGGAHNESSNLLKREIEAEFSRLKIEEDSTPERRDAPANEVIETSTTVTQKTNECETSFDQSKNQDILKQTSAIRESPKTSQQLQQQQEKQETQQPQVEQQPQQHPQQMSQQDEKQEHQSDLHLQQVPRKEEPPQQSPADTTGPKAQDSERVHKRVTLSKSALEFVDSSKSSSEAAKLLAEKRLSADDLIRESGKQNIGFKVNHLMAALEKQGSYAEALSNQKKVLNQRGTAVESGQRVKEQLQQLKSPNPTTSDVKKSPKPVRKPQPLLSRSKTVDDPHATQYFSFGADPDFELYLKSRKERFSPSTDEEASRAKESEKLKDKIGDMGDMVVPMSERIKNMESLVGGSFFSALRDKALSSNEGSSTKPEDQIPQSLQASFDVISDVTVGDKRRDFGKLKEHAMETRRSIQQRRQTQRQTEDNLSPSSSQMFQVTAQQQQPYILEQDIIYQQEQHLKYDEPQQLQYSSACRGDLYNQLSSNYQQQQQAGDEYYQQHPQQQHGHQQRQRERYRQPLPRQQQQQQLSSYESTELFTSSLRDLPPQGMPLGRRGTGKTRSQTNVHGTVTMRTSPATTTTTTTPQRRSLCTKFDSDDEFDKLVEINYQQLVEPQEEQQQQYYHQPQEPLQQYYQQPVQQQYSVQQQALQQQQYELPLQQQQQHLDPRQHVQKHHERHHSPSSYPREPRHQHQPQRHLQQHQQSQHQQPQQPQQQQQPPHQQQLLQQQKPPIDPGEEIAVGSVIDLVSQWDAAIEQKLLRQQQLQVAQPHSSSSNFNVNASGNVSGRSPTSASQKQTTSGDGRCPAGTTTSGQRAAAPPPSTSAARRVSIEDAATGDELTKLSISEKMKIFSIEAEKQRRKANAGRSRRHDSRYQTQPVTWGEVESAQSHVRESSNQRTGSRVTLYERHDEQDEEFDEPIAERDYVYFGDC